MKKIFCLLALVINMATTDDQPLSQYELFMTSLRTGDTEIFATNPVTGDTRNITRSPKSEDRYPAVSADGKQVLFTSNRWGNGEHFNVFLTDPMGQKVEQLTQLEDVCYFPTWSADGHTVAFGIGNTSEAGLLNIKTRKLTRLADVRDPYLSPDGTKITFTRKVKKGFAVFIMDRDGRNVQQLTRHESELGGVGPVFSPDGRKILYCDDVDGKEISEIFVVDTNGSNKRQLTQLGKVSNSACFSPDGQWITFRVTNDAFWRDATRREAAYKNKEGDKRPVWIMQADGSNPHPVEPLRFQCGIDGSRAVWRRR